MKINQKNGIKGMTLVELMVSLVILMLVLGAIYSILNMQQTRATQVSRTTILQTDAQVAFTLLKWDLLIAGLGYPFGNQDAVQLIPVGGTQGAGIGLKAAGLGFEMNRLHWSYVLDAPGGPEMILRRWQDSLANFAQGDTIAILDAMRNPILGYEELIVQNNPMQDTLAYVDSLWGDIIPAQRVNVGVSVSTIHGSIVMKKHSGIYYGGLTYQISGDTLKRGTEALLNNVEAIAFRYGIDTDGDEIIDSWGDINNPPFNPNYNRKWAIRFTMVVTSEGMPGYTYPDNSVTIEDNPPYTYPLNDIQKRRKRAILSSIVYPQNLQPGEEL